MSYCDWPLAAVECNPLSEDFPQQLNFNPVEPHQRQMFLQLSTLLLRLFEALPVFTLYRYATKLLDLEIIQRQRTKPSDSRLAQVGSTRLFLDIGSALDAYHLSL
jgi:hypothetical protein